MKTQILALLVAMALVSMVMTATCDQDKNCREIAKGLGYSKSQIDLMSTFKLYGPPRYPETCAEKCSSGNMNIGFEYYGRQACCCATIR